jgi:predicted Ser/Thr protein kinase
MALCVAQGCKRDCLTGVDMAKMKVEFLHHMLPNTATR